MAPIQIRCFLFISAALLLPARTEAQAPPDIYDQPYGPNGRYVPNAGQVFDTNDDLSTDV